MVMIWEILAELHSTNVLLECLHVLLESVHVLLEVIYEGGESKRSRMVALFTSVTSFSFSLDVVLLQKSSNNYLEY